MGLVFEYANITCENKMPRQYLNLPNRPAGLPFSDAVLSGGTLYISGRIGFVPGTMQLPPDPAEEARYLLEGFAAVLALADMQMDDLLYLLVFSPDVGLFDCFNREYIRNFHKDLPARAFLGSGPLLFGARFEMTGIASRI